MQSSRQPMQMTHNDVRFMEQSLLSDLSAKYGVDSSQRDARQPTALRGVVEYQFASEHGPASPSAEGKKKANGASSGGELMSQLILAHLEILRCTHVADSLRQEMRSFGFDESYYVASQSPINLFSQAALPLSVLALTGEQTASRRGDTTVSGRNDVSNNSRVTKGNMNSQSPIAMLLTPHAVTRECIGRLLNSAPQDIATYCNKGEEMSEASIVKHLTEAIEQPIWSEVAGDALLLRRHPTSSKIIAATLNQLVEELTCVFYNPIASRTAQAQLNDDSFVSAFLLTYKNFCTPKGLLAKLMQRCFVPSSLEVGDLFEGAGIRFYTPNGMMPTVRLGGKGAVAATYGKRTTAWLMITQLVQVRVLSVLAVWLRDFPHHFDVLMLQSILLFLEEVCYQPTAYADCPAKLMQCAEFVKEYAAMILSGRSQHESAFDPPTLQALDGYVVASGAAGIPTPKSAVDVIVRSLEVFQRGSGSLLAALLSEEGAHPPFGGKHHSRSADAVDTASRALSDEFLKLSLEGLVTYISACSNLLFREVKVDAIQFVAVSGSIQRSNGNKGVRTASMGIAKHDGPSSSTQHAVHGEEELRNFFAHAERLMTWTVGLCLGAASRDIQQGSSKGSKFPFLEAVVHKFVELATLLIEKNDLHSAFGVVSGLNHPALARLHHDIFSPTFLFFDRVTSLIRFFDTEATVDYMQYVTSIPRDDASPVVPLLHVTVAEIRKLFQAQPTLYRVPEGGGRFTDMTAPNQQAGEGASLRPELTRSSVVVHWRKFQVLASLLDEVTVMQGKQMPHNVLHAVIDALHTIDEEQRRGGKTSKGSGGGSGGGATILQVAESLEHRQWRALELFDMNHLVNISFTVLPREAMNE